MYRRSQGFSLIEMLVAMVIMAMSLGALYEASSTATRNVGIDEKYSYAFLLAESLLAEYDVVDIGGITEGGTTAGGFRWQVSASPLGGEYPAALAEDKLQAISIIVSWGESRRVRLDSIVAGRPLL